MAGVGEQTTTIKNKEEKMEKKSKICAGRGCRAQEISGGINFTYIPFLGESLCFSCLVKVIKDIEIITFPNPMLLKFDPKESKLKAIFEYSKTARSLWMLYRSSHLYGSPVSDYFESSEFLSDCQKFNDTFNTHGGSVEACTKIFFKIYAKVEWWVVVRQFLGPDNYYFSDRQDLEYTVTK